MGGFCKIKDLKSETCAVFAHCTVLAWSPVKCISSKYIVDGKKVLCYSTVMHYISVRINTVKKLDISFFQDIIDDDSDLEDISIVPSSKVNQRSVCLLHLCYFNCCISDLESAEPRELIHYPKQTDF